MTATWKRGKQPPRRDEPKTINHALIALRRAFNWAVENDLLTGQSPFARINLLQRNLRYRLVTEEEYQALFRNCKDQAFKDVLVAMRLTDVRPGELRRLRWSMVDWGAKHWFIPEHKTSKTSRRPAPRVIGMHPELEAVLRRRHQQSGGSEFVFLNRQGQQWKRNALGLRMRRLRQKAGIAPDANGEQLTLYCNRRTFATEMADEVSIPEAVRTLALGHTDPRTTQESYIRLQARRAAEATRKTAERLAGQRERPGMRRFTSSVSCDRGAGRAPRPFSIQALSSSTATRQHLPS
jgi:integrase